MPNEPLERRSGPAPLPSALRAGLKSMSGHDLSGVQVHANSALPATVGALAYTQGTQIHLAPGQEQHLPREGQPLNDHPALERESGRDG